MSEGPNLPQLPPVEAPPPADDPLAVREMIRACQEFALLNTTARQEFQHQQHVLQIQQDRDDWREAFEKMEAEAIRLRAIEVEHARLSASHRFSRLVDAVSGVAIAIGAGFIGAFCSSTEHPGVLLYGTGWGLTGIACVILILKAICDL